MYLESIKLINYRNYEDISQTFAPSFNILVGMNAQGKTNLIEAIYYLSTGRAYRPARDAQLVRWNSDFFVIAGKATNKNGSIDLEIRFRNSLVTSKEIRINGVKKNRVSELLGIFTSVLFAPEDINIIKGAPGERRRIIDNDIAQVSPAYYLNLQKYARILNQRNSLLKKITTAKKGTREELEVWNEQYIAASEEIIKKRLQGLEKLGPLTRLMQRKLTGGKENLEIKYLLDKRIEVKDKENLSLLLKTLLDKYREEEIIRGQSLWGPHRDDFSILLNGSNLKFYGSQGQHRTAVLALKLAELEFFKAETGEYPVLLLDDVLSELDENRREYLVDTIKNKDIQCFISTTEEFPEKLKITGEKRIIINGGQLFC